MRKQDRLAREQQNRPHDESDQQQEPQEREQMKGSASADRPARPPRESGKLPLPD